jgi:ribosomal protein S18 acetylase RimI-like enzyme
MHIRLIPALETHELRRLVLRKGDRSAVVEWPGDEHPDGFHVGAFIGASCIGIASFQPERNGHFEGRKHYRLRGMATHPEHQGKGVGSALLRHALDHLHVKEADLLWCNARETAIRFYAHAGFRVSGSPFMIEGIGVHFVMYLPLLREAPSSPVLASWT